ncbi:LacI family DNA-binding transcriptional regulator [Sanguibacter suaedae]|uniref:LacI family DNA-binding transcriptional regulator n=1 Tax=Sanguibacter suaedae TaxID=2795737 RepID=A0A934M668_9MICO|nr:LacI family DNA-binding transcriptional regulator [Sanguibacter suaedae]MBI9113922.1 LacI family DNA-binding transcriptional regulator [Sanguibacter suaedae]
MSEHTQPRVPVIADVARAAGVSVPTVSRVLTGSTPVSKEKRERVLAAIRELGYRPNAAARALVSGRQSMIAIVASNTTRYGYAATLHGIEEAARSAGYLAVITVVEGPDDASVRSAVDLVLGQPVAGVIVLEFDEAGMSARHAFPDTVAVVSAVTMADETATSPVVFLDDRTAARDATRYLLDLGHRTVHHVSLPQAVPQLGRTLGWEDALREAGIDVPEIFPASWEPESGRQVGLVLAERDDVTAVVCGNDELAIGLVRGLHEAGRSVPDDVSVVGFDDEPFAAVTIPALTTVYQDFTELGHQLLRRLMELVDTGTARTTSSLAPRLVIRESTAPPRT